GDSTPDFCPSSAARPATPSNTANPPRESSAADPDNPQSAADDSKAPASPRPRPHIAHIPPARHGTSPRFPRPKTSHAQLANGPRQYRTSPIADAASRPTTPGKLAASARTDRPP